MENGAIGSPFHVPPPLAVPARQIVGVGRPGGEEAAAHVQLAVVFQKGLDAVTIRLIIV